MYDDERLEELRKRAAAIAEPIWETLLRDIVRRVRGAGGITSTAEYQIYRAEQLGFAEKAIKAALAEQLKISDAAIDMLFEELRDETVRFEENAELRQLVEAYGAVSKKAAAADYEGLWAPGPDGKLYTVKEAYGKIMDFAWMQTATGTYDFQTAVREATKKLLERGLRVIPGKDGRSYRLEYAVRSYITNRMGEMFNAVNQMNYDAIGADGWEISAHPAPAPDHAPYQGRQYSKEEYDRINNSLARKFGWWNCRHLVYPVRLGVSPRAYSDEQLQKYLDDNEKGVWYNGQHYTLSEARDRKRQLESLISQTKYDILAAEGDDQLLKERQIRLQNQRREYERFCRETGQDPENWRTMVATFGRSEASKAAWAARMLGLRGRASGKTGGADTDGAPMRAGHVDFSNREQVSSTLAKWRQDLEPLDHEEDVSITTDGTIWHTVGGKRRVHPENIQLQQGVSLQGSYSYHNHPPKETYCSFSADDVDFFFRYGVQYQQASDDIYEYTMERTPDTVAPEDAAAEFDRIYASEACARAFEDENWDIDENGYDLVLQQLAELYNFKYERRWKG